MLWRGMSLAIALFAWHAVLARPSWGDDRQFFEKNVEPILTTRCLECHGSDQRGGLDLRTKAGVHKGGESGPAVVAGKPDESPLVQQVTEMVMPPKHPLSADEISALTTWVARGAWFPGRSLDPYAFSSDRRAGYDWWSLQPVRAPPIPEVRESSQTRTPVDPFVLERLAKDGITISAPADRRTLVLRAYVDLLGLRPTYEEIEAFLVDNRPDAFDRLVDRLLASPRYGERWGRHWLDVVRFAESNGFERDRIRENFWRYRDYVIDAFNRDMPYDQIVREQLAGDEMYPGDPRGFVSTGFLVAGPKNDVGTISELEKMTTRQDELDEYVVATMTTFMGLTVGCARCHDHKFDPIPTKDYYSLTAAFSGLDRRDEIVATLAEKERRTRAEADLRLRADQARRKANRILDPARRLVRAAMASESIRDSDKLPALTVQRNEDSFDPVLTKFVRFQIRKTNTGTEPCIDELEVLAEKSEENVALASSGAKARATSALAGFDIHKIEHLNDGRGGNSRSWISGESGRGDATIELPTPRRIDRVVWSRDREGTFQDRLPVDYRISVSLDGTNWRKVADGSKRAPTGDRESAQRIDEAALARLSVAERSEYDRCVEELGRAEADLSKLPPLPTTYAPNDGPPVDCFLLHRGAVRERREKVAPEGLVALRATARSFVDPTNDSGPKRRRLLAEWIVDPRNPLTARVIVNRVWHYHFGQGIVNTPSDFGFNGDRPSHPELLDWLAADFVAHGWRLKRLHRQIMLSAAYRQSSRLNPTAHAKDGANRLLWRMNPRRLESETVRDAVLASAGSLDLTMGGPGFRLFTYRDGNVPDYILLDRPGRETWRRGVYMHSVRTFREPLLIAFDCPDPSVQTPKRETSTTALQALSLFNNRFTFEQANRLAERARRAAGGPDDKPNDDLIRAAYCLALGRRPTADEVAVARQFLGKHDLSLFCRVLLNTNEFLYVE